MARRPRGNLSARDYEVLASFRGSLRKFLRATDENARKLGLTPQQHQALLALKGGFPGQACVTVGQLAQSLQLRNHSTVELVARLVRADLVSRSASTTDRREILVSISPRGHAVLRALSEVNLAELELAAPVFTDLVAMLTQAGFGAGSTGS
ncbi:MAG TPA: MarR family transcriptional regulator [Caulobacteraceae bacterium]|nr:MarR family transcriptional regulator [Caulobacteraceae bacterium]